jgi:hypothetical protein
MSDTTTVSRLRQRMIEDMAARKLNPHTQRSHIQSCKRFAAWLKRSPYTATPNEVRLFQLYARAWHGYPADSGVARVYQDRKYRQISGHRSG